MYVHSKMIPVETVPGIGGVKIKDKNGGRHEFKSDIFDTL
jgi:hypothetical protein